MRTAPPTAIGEAGDTAEKVRNSDLSNPRRAPSSTSTPSSAMPADLDDLAAAIKVEHAAARDAMTTGLQHALRAGEMLIAAKAKVPHGGWLTWLQHNCEVSDRTAQIYMKVARERPRLEQEANPQGLAVLTLESAAKLLAEPKPDKFAPNYIPQPGHALLGKAGDIECVVAPSELAGFFYVTVLALTDDGGADVEASPRPIRSDGIAPFLAAARFPASEAVWTHDESREWDRNMFLDELPEVAVPDETPATPAPKPTTSAEIAQFSRTAAGRRIKEGVEREQAKRHKQLSPSTLARHAREEKRIAAQMAEHRAKVEARADAVAAILRKIDPADIKQVLDLVDNNFGVQVWPEVERKLRGRR